MSGCCRCKVQTKQTLRHHWDDRSCRHVNSKHWGSFKREGFRFVCANCQAVFWESAKGSTLCKLSGSASSKVGQNKPQHRHLLDSLKLGPCSVSRWAPQYSCITAYTWRRLNWTWQKTNWGRELNWGWEHIPRHKRRRNTMQKRLSSIRLSIQVLMYHTVPPLILPWDTTTFIVCIAQLDRWAVVIAQVCVTDRNAAR